MLAEVKLLKEIDIENNQPKPPVFVCGTCIQISINRQKLEHVKAGIEIFENNCSVCHSIHEQVVGPALKNITTRREKKWIIQMISNSQKLIKSGDTAAVKLYTKYGKTEMPAFDFTKEEMNSLIEYLDLSI